MGDGFAIELAGKRVVSPVNAEVILCFPTKHAYGLRTADGKEILIHIGMDTVQLNGEGFTSHVQPGDIVRKGDLLCEVDTDYIRAQGKSLVSPIIFTSGQQIRLEKEGVTVQEMEEQLLTIHEN